MKLEINHKNTEKHAKTWKLNDMLLNNEWVNKQIKGKIPEINPHLYTQLLFDRVSRHTQWVNYSLFSKWCWENWRDTYRKMKLDYLLTPRMRVNLKMLDLNP